MSLCCTPINDEDDNQPPPSGPIVPNVPPSSVCVIVLLGFGGTGRTSLAERIVRDTFSATTLYSRTTEVWPPLLVDRVPHTIVQLVAPVPLASNKSLDEQNIWCARADGFFLCFDLTDAESLYDLDATTWSQPNHRPVVLVGTFGDAPLERHQVSEHAAKEWARRHAAPYVSLSSRTGQGIQEAMETMLLLIQNKLPSTCP